MAYIDLAKPTTWSQSHSHWWRFFLGGIVLATLAGGLCYILYWSFRRCAHIGIEWSTERKYNIPKEVSNRISNFKNLDLDLISQHSSSQKSSSFGVYLGNFNEVLTDSESKILTQWDLLVLDPFATGVAPAISSNHDVRFLGRIDLRILTASKQSVLQKVESILTAVWCGFRGTNFRGVLLAESQELGNPMLLKELITGINYLGLEVYLEVSPPGFLEDQKSLQDSHISGLVIRNATILPNGEKRDYFQQAPLQKTIKAFVGQACLRNFVVAAWETLDEGSLPSNAVVRRSLQWCNFYNVLLCIGSGQSFKNADMNNKLVEPLSYFSWLKEPEMMSIHDIWKSNVKIAPKVLNRSDYGDFKILYSEIDDFLDSKGHCSDKTIYSSILSGPPQWPVERSSMGNALSVSPFGLDYTGLGCFPLGCDVSAEAFRNVLKSQKQLNQLGLLHPVPIEQLQDACALLDRFEQGYLSESHFQATAITTAIRELRDICSKEQLHVYLGLDSGFRRSNENRFWAICTDDGDLTEIYVSKNAPGLTGTMLHAFLAYKGVSRGLCLEIEVALSEWSKDLGESGLPRRLELDIEQLTPSECLQYIRHLTLVGDVSDLPQTICACLKRKLIDSPTLCQLKYLSTSGYLSGKVSALDLIQSRITWYQIQGCEYPSLEQSLSLFSAVDESLDYISKTHRETDLVSITLCLKKLLRKGSIDACVDMFALALFCAVRRAAFDEIYNDVTDRNPLFNTQSDQAAAFAESFALGSRCEAYFDMPPSAFGKLLSDRFRQYYEKHPPPSWVNGAPELATSYAGAQIDVDPDHKAKEMPRYQRFSFLSVFTIPALIDILLLTFIGRGIYLSESMMDTDLQMATTALMISLLLSGAIGTWISLGGSYYMVSMAFSAMNMFVLTRLISGLAFTFLSGLIGFIVISAIQGPREAVIFVLYLFALTAYLSLFATLACYSYPGAAFLSGRKTILTCMPILFISPIITTFVGYDSLVYIIVLYAFIGSLFIGLRSTAANWVTWYQDIRTTDDAEIKEWYIKSLGSSEGEHVGDMSDPAVLKLAREALLRAVLAKKKKRLFTRSTSDSLVDALAESWDSTNFLVHWYCRYSDVPLPIVFSSAWNIQTRVALDTIRNAQKGIRLHNAFILWRQAGKEIGCGILFFVIALLDKWVDLLCGGQLLGLAPGPNNDARAAIGLGLAYYLIGAVLIDIKAQHLHSLLAVSPDPLRSVAEVRIRQKDDVRLKRRAYWITLMKFFAWHIWTVAVTGILVWWFSDSLQSVIMYCAYIFAYTGLLWYQYTKIFAGSQVLMPLVISAVVGLPVGICLRTLLPKFAYSSVIALASATWCSALLSLLVSKIRMPKKSSARVSSDRAYHAYEAPWSGSNWSQEELKMFCDRNIGLPQSSRLLLSPHCSPGSDVKTYMQLQRPRTEFIDAFPNYDDLIKSAIASWESNNISIELIFRDELGPGITALSYTENNHLKILIAVDKVISTHPGLQGHIQIIAETFIHAATEFVFGVPHENAIFAQSFNTTGISETISRQIQNEPDHALIAKWANNEAIRQLCLGVDSDSQWDKLSFEVRLALLDRCLENTSSLAPQQSEWLEQNVCKSGVDLTIHIARCNFSCSILMDILDLVDKNVVSSPNTIAFNKTGYLPQALENRSVYTRLFRAFSASIAVTVKYIAMAIIAEPEFQRELNFMLKEQNKLWRVPLIITMNSLWIYSKTIQDMVHMWFLFHKRPNVKRLWNETKGYTIKIKKDQVVFRNLNGNFTGYIHQETDGFRMHIHSGTCKTEPTDLKSLKYINIYSKDMQLRIRKEFENGFVVNEYHYEYRGKTRKALSKEIFQKIPMSRRCVSGRSDLETIQYNRKGLVEAGSYIRDENLVRFKYNYRKNARSSDELLRAEFVMNHLSCTISWCAPPHRHAHKFERWIPHSAITEATYVYGEDVFESRWLYDHKFHPTIFTYLNGQRVQTPPMIEFDHLGILEKPRNISFLQENPLLFCDSLKTNPFSRLLGLRNKIVPVSTSRARSGIWKAWKERSDFDGVAVRWMDERLLRNDKVLAPYWRNRDRGNLLTARKYLERHADAVVASVDLDGSVSSWTPLAVKLGDLFNFGAGGDTVNLTRSKEFSFESEDKLHVLAADNGTWPNEGGGVSACRRDMINGLRTIKWHMISESAHDFGVPKHQTERNIHSLKVIPLWGLDFLIPNHGLFQNKLDAEIDGYAGAASDIDIKLNFVPILTALVKSARAINLSHSDIQQTTRAFMNLNTYFDSFRHWGQVWTSDVVKEQWRDLWLTQDMPNTIPSSQWLETELPTLGQLDTALELWYRYLFIFSIPVPAKIPPVFQASHHSVSATYGVVCKIKRNCTLQIWDHAISWRETNLCLSSALCKLSPFVRNALLGLMRVTSVLILHHADIVSPCADFFNPDWEVEIGTSQGTLEHRNRFRRKVDPVVNGITDMQRFTPVKEIKSEKPTVTMLSHVWYAKDIKTAILAADLIINRWKFNDYHLDIYGAIDKAPTYSTECQELIASKGLRGRVTLRGTANPMKVLENTWLFLNSSLSEGLPLALGEAALTGAPVVCTDVGASLRVLSDPDDFSRFSAVVAPNDAQALAKAQIQMLAMIGEWSKYAEDTEPAPILSSSPTPEEVEIITRRMYDKKEQRRKLGMMTRKIVQKSFSGDRYLREHEQMLWVGKSLKTRFPRDHDLIRPEYDSETGQILAGDDHIIAMPPDVMLSGRSSTSAASSLFTSTELRNSAFQPATTSTSYAASFSSMESSTYNIRHPRLPVFAPQGLYKTALLNGRRSGFSAGLKREELRQYRHSDVIIPGDFLRRSTAGELSNNPTY